MAHPDRGDFSYYQGLNFLVAYVLDLLRDPKPTYDVCMGLVDGHMRAYVGDSLQGVDVLAHTLRRLVELFLAGLAVYAGSDDNMISSATSANWMLTVFTVLKKFKRRVRLLDQVVDIFVAQGWVGFFKCALVLFYYLEPDLLECGPEDLLVFMNDFARRGFRKLGEAFPTKSQHKKQSIELYSDRSLRQFETGQVSFAESDTFGLETPQFDFKREIKRFDLVSKLLLTDLSVEFKNANSAYEQQWSQVLQKIEMMSKK